MLSRSHASFAKIDYKSSQMRSCVVAATARAPDDDDVSFMSCDDSVDEDEMDTDDDHDDDEDFR